tara:strand:- start:4 stop:624 length:621 start_codon:yes stop_codon:yes gene_type:complete
MALTFVSNTGIADGAVGVAEIAAGTISAIGLEDASVTAAKVANLGLAANTIAAGAITTAKLNVADLSTGNVVFDHVASSFTAAINMQDNIIQRAKLQDTGEVVVVKGDLGGGTDDFDLSTGNVFTATVSTSTSTFTFSNPSASGTACTFLLILTNGGSQTVNFPGSVDFAGGTAPTLTTSGVDVLVFTTVDGGTTYHGIAASTDSK